jgi:hypothetical protein
MVQPTPLYISWCSGATANKGLIAAIAQNSVSNSVASLQDGLPILTMTYAGGVPPRGADFNGAFKWVYDYCLWINGGGQFPFDASYATTPGYAIGAVVQLTGGLSSYVNLANNNTNNPNSVLTNWAPWAGAVKTNVADLISTNITLGAALVAYVVASGASYAAGTVGAGIYSALTNAASALTQANTATTNAATAQSSANTANTAITNLATSTSGAVGAGMVGYAASNTYSGGTVGAAIKAVPASLFATQNNVTGSRAIGTTYTNTTGKPMYVSVATGVGSGNNTLNLTINGVSMAATSANSANSLTVSGIVPAGVAYLASWGTGTGTLASWVETY